MEAQEKQVTITGNGEADPILAKGKRSTAEGSKPSQPHASIESQSSKSGSTKPITLQETLSLLQTDCFDLKSFGCRVAVQQGSNFIAIIVQNDSQKIGFDTGKGNITLDGVPVSRM